MKKLSALMLGLAVAIGCHAQVPPATSHTVTLTWSTPTATSTWTGCSTSQPCSYAIYRAAASSGNCPVSSSAAYSEVTNPLSRPTGTSFTDPTAGGLTVCYIGETIQGASNSGPSNTTASVSVPGTPTAPALGNPTAAHIDEVKPALPTPGPVLAIMHLMARVGH